MTLRELSNWPPGSRFEQKWWRSDILALGFSLFDMKILNFFSCIILCKINWPPWRKQFWAHIWTNFEEVLQAILHNKYLSTRHCFRQEHFWRLPNVNLCKNKWSLWPMGHNLKNLCRRSDRGSYTTNISALWWFPFGCLGNWFRFRTL